MYFIHYVNLYMLSISWMATYCSSHALNNRDMWNSSKYVWGFFLILLSCRLHDCLYKMTDSVLGVVVIIMPVPVKVLNNFTQFPRKPLYKLLMRFKVSYFFSATIYINGFSPNQTVNEKPKMVNIRCLVWRRRSTYSLLTSASYQLLVNHPHNPISGSQTVSEVPSRTYRLVSVWWSNHTYIDTGVMSQVCSRKV